MNIDKERRKEEAVSAQGHGWSLKLRKESVMSGNRNDRVGRRKPTATESLPPKGWRKPTGRTIVGVRTRTEIIRMFMNQDGETSFEADNGHRKRDETKVELNGAFGFYFVDREVLLIERKGGQKPAMLQGVDNVSRTFFHPDCVIATAKKHLEDRPNTAAKLTNYLVENEDAFLVGFEVDGHWHYQPCEVRDVVLPQAEE